MRSAISYPRHDLEGVRPRKDQHLYALVLKMKYNNKVIILTGSAILGEFNRSETIAANPKTFNPYRGTSLL